MLYRQDSPFNYYTDNIVFNVPVNMNVKELSQEIFGQETELLIKT